jgi:DnaJ-class molecular chaperone
MTTCKVCNGDGGVKVNGVAKTCPYCKGTGKRKAK